MQTDPGNKSLHEAGHKGRPVCAGSRVARSPAHVQRGGAQAQLLAGQPGTCAAEDGHRARSCRRRARRHRTRQQGGPRPRRARGRVRRPRYQSDLHDAGVVHPAQGCGSTDPGRGLRRGLTDLLVDDSDRLVQVRLAADARPQPWRRRRHGTRRADPASRHRPHRVPRDTRDLRRGPVLRRRHDHTGDLRHLRGRGTRGCGPQPGASRRADLAGNPDRPVRGAAKGDRRRWLVVRPAAPRVVPRDRAARRATGDLSTPGCSRRCHRPGALAS